MADACIPSLDCPDGVWMPTINSGDFIGGGIFANDGIWEMESENANIPIFSYVGTTLEGLPADLVLQADTWSISVAEPGTMSTVLIAVLALAGTKRLRTLRRHRPIPNPSREEKCL